MGMRSMGAEGGEGRGVPVLLALRCAEAWVRRRRRQADGEEADGGGGSGGAAPRRGRGGG